MLFMVPSDPAYGGSRPQIAKGNVDEGEDLLTAALREAEEELGFVEANIATEPIEAWGGGLVGMKTGGGDLPYSMKVFAVQVKDKSAFTDPHYETGSVHWLSAEEFAQVGRASQNEAVQITAMNILRVLRQG